MQRLDARLAVDIEQMDAARRVPRLHSEGGGFQESRERVAEEVAIEPPHPLGGPLRLRSAGDGRPSFP